jgi:uncharacterized protein YjbI with pentapeptide repeats
MSYPNIKIGPGAHLEGADLQGEDLQRANLRGAHLEGAFLQRADLRDAHLENAHLEGAHLERALLNRAHLEGAHLEGAYLENAHLEGAHLQGAYLERAQLQRAHLEEAHLEGAQLQGRNLQDACLSGAHLQGAHLQGADLRGADLRSAHLERAHLEGAILRGADLSGAHLQEAYLQGAHLERAYLEEAELEGAHLERAHLEGVDLSGVDLSGVDLSGVDLSNRQREQIAASARRSVSASAFAGDSALTISSNIFGKVINIPRELRVGTKNSASNSCPNYEPLYYQLMLVDLDGRFRFHFEGESGIGPGLTKMVYGFLLPVYTKLYFVEAQEFIILKKDVNIEKLNRDTSQLIKLAKAAQSQIYLQIDPRLLELLLQENPAESIERNNNFNKLYANLKARVSDVISAGANMSNYLPENTSNQSIRSLDNINSLSRKIQAEIILRKRLFDIGFVSWVQYQNMATFIKTFWENSNSNRGRNVKNPLFSCEIKYDIESFMKRLQIKREDTQQFLDLQEVQSLYGVYPALRPLLEYVLDPSENGNENRRKIVKYVAGTEYTLCRILISLQNLEIPFDMSNRTKIYRLPFLPHTCSSALDLFKTPASKNYQEVWTVARIDEEITKGSGLAAHN